MKEVDVFGEKNPIAKKWSWLFFTGDDGQTGGRITQNVTPAARARRGDGKKRGETNTGGPARADELPPRPSPPGRVAGCRRHAEVSLLLVSVPPPDPTGHLGVLAREIAKLSSTGYIAKILARNTMRGLLILLAFYDDCLSTTVSINS